MKYALLMVAALLVSRSYALSPGDAVPNIRLPSTSGESVSLADWQGQWIVLYFYPRAFTPGCTSQSCSLRDEFGEIQERGAVILGASLDSIERQNQFKEEHQLPFDLLSDEQKELARAFDSLMIGGMMASRKTFIVNPEGLVVYRFDSPDTRNHGDEVIHKLDELMSMTIDSTPTAANP
jgi:thioredoxin-dependent peroxiredoxin